MILTCPSCSTRYSIDAASIGPEGRLVKCAKCGHKWREFPPEDLPKQVQEEPEPQPDVAAPQAGTPDSGGEDATMSIEAMTRASKKREEQRARKKKIRRRILGWVLFVLILAGIGVGGYYGRNTVVQFWPASAKLYQKMKLDVKTANKLGLEIRDLENKSVSENGVTRLTVYGKIVNITGEDQPVPRIGIQLVDSNGLHVYSWSTSVEQTTIPAWETIEFSSSMNQPPEEAKHVKAHLIAPKKLGQEQN
ncbi:DUF3426 domain-containing protein [Sneathiella glossodoripedis]|uniref:DUF3426 domain-containing protein n=1 Tax=Sneathiella glossodoripedis TaxID=418853 RepID=UPI00046F2977|nr:DUF3426 domain-containing protein [Sneathiella glossodoripedis]